VMNRWHVLLLLDLAYSFGGFGRIDLPFFHGMRLLGRINLIVTTLGISGSRRVWHLVNMRARGHSAGTVHRDGLIAVTG
jgi:hypothetical protein